MDKRVVTVSSLDCDIVRSAFRKSVIEENIPKDRWREHAALLIRDFTGSDIDDIDPELLEWITRK